MIVGVPREVKADEPRRGPSTRNGLQKGRGVLLGGVAGVEPGRVLVLGGGVVGTCAAKVAAGMGADVVITDAHLERLRYLDDVIPRKVTTIFSDPHAVRRFLQ